MATETKVTRGLVKELVDRGAVVVPYVASAMQPAGYPDRVIWSVQWCGWLELKGPRTPLEKIQRMRIDELNRRRWGSAWVFRFATGSKPAAWTGALENSTGEKFSGPIGDAGLLLAQLQWLSRDSEGPK